ncbi:hypothetical protein WEB32_18050 [Streptomyces netropsis]|uniref:Uncharacterized protein n=1 Tax=Streptomyces netropsis TaxID=55404 RepID=A0A7W7LI01_STRNE|nr:hypothetical protein [Streptomyces netropsis]MBB4890575.1 hypothetical protein [Streptomyces netropsis]GGR50197.1 hypothetical protein GCM10010219_64400 [Streptomyces netropsis]
MEWINPEYEDVVRRYEAAAEAAGSADGSGQVFRGFIVPEAAPEGG